MKGLDFFCIGAQKAGTTTLHDILAQHPDIYLPPEKEAHFWSVDEFYAKGIEWYYEKYFNTYDGEKLVGNINPQLHAFPKALNRICEHYDPQCLKIIFILRHPVDRAYSHYLMSQYRGLEPLSFIDALDKEQFRLNSKAPSKYSHYSKELGHFEKSHRSYVNRSRYYPVIQRLYDVFDEKNILIYKMEDFINKNSEYIKLITDFLEIDQYDFDLNIKSNQAKVSYFQSINSFVNQKSVLKNITKVFIKEDKRRYLKKQILSLNKRDHKNHQTNKGLEKQTVEEVFEHYFQDDIIKCEEFLKRKLYS